MIKKLIVLLLMMLIIASSIYSQEDKNKKKYNLSYKFDLGMDLTTFIEDAAYEGQRRHYPSISLKPEISIDWDNGKSNIIFEGFGRWDLNGESRTHWDVREFYYQFYTGNLEFSVGLKKIFWGKTEGVHLVDVINQVDFLEGLDGEEKLGQPMLTTSYTSNIGTFSWFLLPYSRTIDFGNAAGRPRTPQVIVADIVSFESDREEWQPTFALRWEHCLLYTSPSPRDS